MSLRGLLALVVLLAAVVASLAWLGRKTGPPASQAADAPLLRAFDEDAVREIDLTCAGADVTLRKETPGWRIIRPIEAEADPRRVHDVVTGLRESHVRKVIADKAGDLAAFGLAPAACIVRLGFAGGAPALSLRLGRGSPVGTERYAAMDDQRIVLTDGALYGVVSRGADAFREKRLVPVEAEAITRIALDRLDGRLVVTSTDGVWRVESPFRDLASSGACAGLARAITAIELAGPSSARPPERSVAQRRIRLEVTTRGGGAPVVAVVAAAGIGGTRLGWRDRSIAGLVEESAAKELERPTESFRDPRIAPFFSPDVRKLTIERGATTLRLVRAKEPASWSGSDGTTPFPVDGSRVGDLLDRLSGLSGVGFETTVPAAKATGTITIEGEHGEIGRWSFGPLVPSSGSDVESLWVTTPARPGVVFRIHAASFGPIPAKAADLAPVAPAASPRAVNGS